MQEDLVIHKIFSCIVQRFANQVALQIKEGSAWRRVTYKEVEFRAKNVAVFLIRQGYQKGDCAALILENSPEWGIIYLGIMYAGLTCVAVDFELSQEELNNIFQDCLPKLVFTSYKHKDKIAFPSAKLIIVDSDDFKRIQTHQMQDVSFPDVLPSDVASLIYTSGTTAKPKGVILTHSNFCANFQSIEKEKFCTSKDNLLSILPLYHTYAFMVTLLVPLLSGAKVTYIRGFKPEDLVQIIKEQGITILVGVPQLFTLMYKAILDKIKNLPFLFRPLLMPILKQGIRGKFGKSLRFFVSGGARLEPETGKGLSRLGLKIIEGYGLTETSPVVTINSLENPRFGSVGKPIADVQVRILNPDNSGVGEVLIKGPNVMQGYFKHPRLTAQVKSLDGWFNSQDLGYLDKDGYLFLTGRKKDVIVLSSGKNIYPEELEEYYNRSPYIKEICILEKHQERFDRKVILLSAVIVPDFEYFRRNKEINIQEKIRWELENLSSKLPPYKRIMGFTVITENLPRTPLNKIKRFQVKSKYFKQQDEEEISGLQLNKEDKELLESKAGQDVIKYLSSQLKKRIDLDSHLEIDLGIDSLSRVEIGAGLESLLSIKIPDEFVDNILTVKELIIGIQRIIRTSKAVYDPLLRQEERTWRKILSESPGEEVLGKIRITSGFIERVLVFIFKSIFTCIFRLFWPLKISGREFIPNRGPYVFFSNHASYLDGFVLFASVPVRSAMDLFFIGHAKIFEHPLVSWAVKIARLISIDPVAHLTVALQAASFVLEHKKIICIFPEGSRSINSNVQDFKRGIGILAKELNIPLIPVYIKGSHFSWPRTKRFPRIWPLKVIFGKPVFWQDLGNDYETIAKGLREEVLKLKEAGSMKQETRSNR
ncbi:MAG: AMP-binding protein [Candidatus Omnitrophota bacterium]